MTDDLEGGKNLFDEAIERENKQIMQEAVSATDDQATGYVSGGGLPDLKASIIDITKPKDARVQELLTKELTLSNITKNEVRVGMLYSDVILSFSMENETDLAAEWLGKLNSWLLLNRSVDFQQQKILATQIRGLYSMSKAPEKKEII